MRKLKTVDKLAAINKEIQRLTKQREKLTTSLKMKGPGTYAGEHNVAIVSEYVKTGFDKTIAEKFMTKAQFTQCLKTSHVTTVTVKEYVPVS